MEEEENRFFNVQVQTVEEALYTRTLWISPAYPYTLQSTWSDSVCSNIRLGKKNKVKMEQRKSDAIEPFYIHFLSDLLYIYVRA